MDQEPQATVQAPTRSAPTADDLSSMFVDDEPAEAVEAAEEVEAEDPGADGEVDLTSIMDKEPKGKAAAEAKAKANELANPKPPAEVAAEAAEEELTPEKVEADAAPTPLEAARARNAARLKAAAEAETAKRSQEIAAKTVQVEAAAETVQEAVKDAGMSLAEFAKLAKDRPVKALKLLTEAGLDGNDFAAAAASASLGLLEDPEDDPRQQLATKLMAELSEIKATLAKREAEEAKRRDEAAAERKVQEARVNVIAQVETDLDALVDKYPAVVERFTPAEVWKVIEDYHRQYSAHPKYKMLTVEQAARHINKRLAPAAAVTPPPKTEAGQPAPNEAKAKSEAKEAVKPPTGKRTKAPTSVDNVPLHPQKRREYFAKQAAKIF